MNIRSIILVRAFIFSFVLCSCFQAKKGSAVVRTKCDQYIDKTLELIDLPDKVMPMYLSRIEQAELVKGKAKSTKKARVDAAQSPTEDSFETDMKQIEDEIHSEDKKSRTLFKEMYCDTYKIFFTQIDSFESFIKPGGECAKSGKPQYFEHLKRKKEAFVKKYSARVDCSDRK